MKTLCTLFVLMCACLGSFAQTIRLKGTVRNGDRQPVEFANIVKHGQQTLSWLPARLPT